MNDALTAILTRRSAIDAEIASLRQRIDVLQQEIPDLDAAERVIRRLTVEQDEGAKADAAETGKPEGTPPVSEMILLALANAHRHGEAGLVPQGLLEVIRAAWWPNATTDSVGPIAWRMWKTGKLGKEGTLYFRLDRNEIWRKKNEAPADRHPQGASELSGESGTSPELARKVPDMDFLG